MQVDRWQTDRITGEWRAPQGRGVRGILQPLEPVVPPPRGRPGHESMLGPPSLHATEQVTHRFGGEGRIGDGVVIRMDEDRRSASMVDDLDQGHHLLDQQTQVRC